MASALMGPTRSAPPSSIQAIEPPPAPMALMSIVGSRIGIWPILACRVVSGRPLRIRLMSVLVPPNIHGDDVRRAGKSGEVRAGDDAAGRPGQDGVHRFGERRLDRHQAARRFHHHDGLVAADAEPGLAHRAAAWTASGDSSPSPA